MASNLIFLLQSIIVSKGQHEIELEYALCCVCGCNNPPLILKGDHYPEKFTSKYENVEEKSLSKKELLMIA